MRTLYYEDGLDEIALIHNPKGGRPALVGQLCHTTGTEIDIEQIKEDVTFRYHVGYCTCGKRLVIGPKRAELVARALAKRGITGQKQREHLSTRLRLWAIRTLQNAQ